MAQAESTRIEAASYNRTKSHPTYTTVEMLQMALSDLQAHSTRGVTLQAIKKHISEKFGILIKNNKKRNNLIQNYLRSLLSDGFLVNLTGRGLVGHLRYVGPSSKSRKSNTKQTKTRRAKKTQRERDDGYEATSPAPPAPAPAPAPASTSTSTTSLSDNEAVRPTPLVARAPARLIKRRTDATTASFRLIEAETPLSSQSQTRLATALPSDDRESSVYSEEAVSKHGTVEPISRLRPKRRRLFEKIQK